MTNQPKLRAEQIIAAVCQEWGITLEQLLVRRRGASRRRLREPRYVAAHLMCRVYGYSQVQAGQALDGRDHSTIANSLRMIERAFAGNHYLAERAKKVRNRLDNPPPEPEAAPVPPRRPPPSPPTSAQTRVAAPFVRAEFPANEARQLYRRGWSVKGLCRRYGLTESGLEALLGIKLRMAA